MEFCVRPPAPDELAQIGMVHDQAAAFQKANGIVQWEPGVYPTVKVARDALSRGILYGFYVDGTLAVSYTHLDVYKRQTL